MATYKRRIVYFTDEEWANLRIQADEKGVTISAYLRSFGWSQSKAADHAATRPAPLDTPLPQHHMTQGERDAILRKVNRRPK